MNSKDTEVYIKTSPFILLYIEQDQNIHNLLILIYFWILFSDFQQF